ncbi:hypothetical protein GCM10010510_70080 [Streptomyces anandii JCM 4720]|nr:hypothetical protein GCM10010510_70080 [Streptomyces anandii JCM 4720]
MPGAVVGGELVAAAGPDLHLAVDGGGVVVLDTRLMTGWELGAAGGGAGTGRLTVPVRELRVPRATADVQEGLF